MKFSAILSLIFGITMLSGGDDLTYQLKSGDYSLSISPRYRQTMRSIVYKNALLATPNGYYNLVIGEFSGKFVGAGHNEGGEEQMESFTLNVDGKTVTPEIGGVYSGEKIELLKVSRLLNCRFVSRILLTPAGIWEQKRFLTLADQKFSYLYLYLFCFNKTTSDYLALDASGKKFSGKFDGNFSGSNRWHIEKDLKYAAVYEQNSQQGLLLYFPQIINGSSRKSAFWEVKKAYNKFYTMAEVTERKAGFVSPEYSLFIKGFTASAPELALTVEKCAESVAKIPVPMLPQIALTQAQTLTAPVVKVKDESKKINHYQPTFNADFTLADDKFDAQQSGGSPKAELLLEPKMKVNFDNMSHSIRGIQVGKGHASLRYQTKNNLPIAGGTMEMTFSNNWAGDANEVIVLAQSCYAPPVPGLGKFYLYKNKKNGIAAYFEVNGAPHTLFLNQNTDLWQKDSWHHLLVTYTPDEIIFYIDGKKVKSGKAPAEITSWPPQFTLGAFSKNYGCAAESTISNFSIYNRPLTPEEVRNLAVRRIPALEKSLGKAELSNEDIMLASTKWEPERPRLGLEALGKDNVPPPWSPIEIGNQTFSVWNRQYQFTDGAFLSRVTSGGKNLLATPIVLKVNDKNTVFQKLSLTDTGKGRVNFERNAIGGIRLESYLEYDGMLFNSLQIPTQNLQKITLEISIAKPFAEFLHYVGAPTTYESQNLIKNSNSIRLSEKPGIIFSSPFRTNLWIGNNEAGLLFFTESDQYYYPKRNPRLIEIERLVNGDVILKLHFLAGAIPGENPPEKFNYRFGIMATPVKPLPERWREFTFSAQYDSFQGLQRGGNLIYWTDQWRQISLDPEPGRNRNLAANQARLSRDVANNHKIIPYWTRLHYAVREGNKTHPNGNFLKEWGTIPSRPGGGNAQYDRVALTSPWQDYLVWCGVEWGKVMGKDIDGVYIDETQPIPNANAASGGGYTDFDGSRQPTYEALGSRDMIKRTNYLIYQRTGKQPYSIAHCSATHTMQNVGQYMTMLIGEQFYSGYFSNGRSPELLPPPEDSLYYYSYALPMDRLRAECYNKQWGAVMLFLPCLKNQRELMEKVEPTRDMLSRLLQADMLIWPIFCNLNEIYKTWEYRKEFGIGDSDVIFTPYWENTSIISDTPDAVVGYYKKGEKIMAIVSNLNRKAKKITLDFSNLQIKTVKNGETKTDLQLKNNKLELDLKRNDYMVLRINY